MLSNLNKLKKTTQLKDTRLMKLLDRLCDKGLIIDIFVNGEYHNIPIPLMIGIFEFTMMRTGNSLDSAKIARLFHEYLHGDNSFYAVNFQNGEQVSMSRALPHIEAVDESSFIEVWDYEKTTALIEEANKFALGICSCRHEKLHAGVKTCDTPLKTCSSYGYGADYLIRHNLATEVSKTEILENVARSKEAGLVIEADNVQKHVTFLCHYCKCCCNILIGFSKYGFANSMVTSSFIATVHDDLCIGCGKCFEACPVNALEMAEDLQLTSKSRKKPVVNTTLCLGCGVCGIQCQTRGITLVKREKRVLHPETTFQRTVLQILERGSLQNYMFDNPSKISHKFMRTFVGYFFNMPPVKKALLSENLRSRFLNSLEKSVILQGRGWLLRRNFGGGKRKGWRLFDYSQSNCKNKFSLNHMPVPRRLSSLTSSSLEKDFFIA